MTTHTHDLSNRVGIVTGAGTGIGAATATALSAGGAKVALLGRRLEPLVEQARRIDGLAVAADVSDSGQLAAAFDQAREAHGPADLVVANAGQMLPATFATADPDEWRRMLDVNVLGLAETGRLAIPDLLKAAADGRPADLVLISSIGAHLTIDKYAVYMASKAAVSHLSRGLRQELGPQGVRVRAIEPGMTATDLGSDMGDQAARDELAEFREQVPPISPELIAEAIAWSCALPADTNASVVEVLPTIQG
ncbi:SDR family NAD(P)-dependent oxidoreductase [Epidermidibacterium keratini]|uniref:SDR family NAD(P)-dependent oxidoreductase n=1 Tax=Epidermidibacterium keratini TaxID=1891644 RepID=A0A7L4YN24_9ACTN|nr:SDR family oxidoreductase [Epidermidibacterium keratini]QHC00675.1 SDR family NAD(P)-dependent oxidoreductase [Epidermidibacterium keratini]